MGPGTHLTICVKILSSHSANALCGKFSKYPHKKCKLRIQKSYVTVGPFGSISTIWTKLIPNDEIIERPPPLKKRKTEFRPWLSTFGLYIP